jgi:hypothetical protein
MSAEQVTTRVPSGLNSALVTPPPWRSVSLTGWPVSGSHNRAVPSSEAVSSFRPFGLKCMLLIKPPWRIGRVMARPLPVSQI